MSNFKYLRVKAARLGFTLEKLKEADRECGKYYLRPHADRDYVDNEIDSLGLWSWKSFCSSLQEVKSVIESIQRDQLSIRIHGTVTYDEEDITPRDINFQCTLRFSCSGLDWTLSAFRRCREESSRRARQTLEEHERRMKTRQAKKAEKQGEIRG